MAVYVDDMRREASVAGRRSRWSHLMADSSEELLSFALRIGLNPSWIQYRGTAREHFDVTDGMRQRAIRCGAVEMGMLELGRWALDRQKAMRHGESA